MANKDKVLAALGNATGLVCDDCLARRAILKQRQTAHSICTQLFRDGAIEREQNTCAYCKGYKQVSRIHQASPALGIVQEGAPALPREAPPWFWEGNVQASLVTWLKANGYSIEAAADTASKEAGKDIIAVGSDGRELWVTVKGYPKGTSNTSPSTQARHWFSHAIFDLVLYRGERQNVALAAAFPDGFKTYQNLAGRVTWLKETVPFTLFWIGSDGKVRQQ